MALPKKGDPRRPIHLAAASCRLIGILGLIAASCAGFSLVAVGSTGRAPPFVTLVIVGSLFFYAGSGAAFLVFAIYIKKRRYWAVMAATVLTGVATLLVGFSVVAEAISVGAGGRAATPGLSPVVLLVVTVLVLAALIQLIVHLTQSFTAIRIDPPVEERGFEVLPLGRPPGDGVE